MPKAAAAKAKAKKNGKRKALKRHGVQIIEAGCLASAQGHIIAKPFI